MYFLIKSDKDGAFPLSHHSLLSEGLLSGSNSVKVPCNLYLEFA